MAKRGKILRDTSAGPGLVMVDGAQHQFSLEGVWKSPVAPAAGMTAEVEFGPDGKITSMTAVPDSQLAKEQAELALATAKAQGTKLAGAAVAKFGLPSLIAVGLLIVCWFFLTAISVDAGFAKLSLTFWDVLGFVNNGFAGFMQSGGRGGGGAGIYGFLALVALAGPFIHHFWKDKRAVLGGLLPLLFMLLVWLMVYRGVQSAMGGPADFARGLGGADGDAMMKQMRDEAMKAVSVGFGTYLSLIVGLYFAATSAKQYLASQASGTLVRAQAAK